MAIPIKAILLEKADNLGSGLTALRTKESTAIDISGYGEAMSDPTSSTNRGNIIKNNKVYTIVRTYINLDKNCRYVIAKNEENPFDRWPAG